MSHHRVAADETPLGVTLARVVMRRWYVVLLPILVVPAAAFYLSLRQPATYAAETKLLISRPQLGALLLDVSLPTEDPIRRAETARALVGVRAVAKGATARLGLPPRRVDEIARMIHVGVGRQSDILTVSASSPSAAQAIRLANAAAASYAALRRRLETGSIARARKRTDKALRLAAPGSARALELRTRLDRLATLDDLADDQAVIVDRAVSATRVSPLPVRTAQFGIALGLILGLALAYVAEALDRRVRGLGELGSILQVPVVGELPVVRRLRGLRRLPAPVRDAPLGVAAEAFRFLETNIALSPVGSRCRSVLVTSANRREGRSTTALNLALSAAESGKRVLLLELDLRHPRLGEVTGTRGTPGVAQIVRGTAALADVRIELALEREPRAPTDIGAVTVVCAGTNISNPVQYLRSAAVDSLVREACERFDLVVIDSPPLLGLRDAMIASSLVDGLLLVVDYRRARRQHLTDLLEIAGQLPAPLIGVVVNRAPRRRLSPPQAYGSHTADTGRAIRAA